MSNNQSLDAAFSSKPLWLDLGYFDYHPCDAAGLHVLGGKMKNPLYTVGKSELLWDPDLNPEGLALQVQPDLGTVSPFVNAGYFWVEERSSQADSFILGGQAGLKLAFEPSDSYVIVGGRYVDTMNIEGQEVFWDPEDSFGNTATDVAGDGILSYDYDYDLLGAFLEIGGKAGRVPWAVFGDFVQNTAVDEESTGWLVGVKAGKCKKALDLCGRYIYRVVEADAVVGIFTDSDFNGGGTDSKGHEVNAGVQLAEGVKSGATYFYNKTSIEHGEDYHRLQLDLKMKF